MKNDLKSKTRLTFIQIIFHHLSTKDDVNIILNTFINNYKGTQIKNFNNSQNIKFEFNDNYLKKLVYLYIKFIKFNKPYLEINKVIRFSRKFEKWDIINQSIILMTIREIRNSEKEKIKIILNDYIEISKFFVSDKETKLINSILDKLINEKI